MEWLKENWFKAGLLAVLFFAAYKYDPVLTKRQTASVAGVVQSSGETSQTEPLPTATSTESAPAPTSSPPEASTTTPAMAALPEAKKTTTPPALPKPVLTKEERCTITAQTEARISATDAVKRINLYNPCDADEGCNVENTAWFYAEISKSIEASRFPIIVDLCLRASTTVAFNTALSRLRAAEKYCGENFPSDTASCMKDNYTP